MLVVYDLPEFIVSGVTYTFENMKKIMTLLSRKMHMCTYM